VPRPLFLAARTVLEGHGSKGKVPQPLPLTVVTCVQAPMDDYLLAKDPMGVLLPAVLLVGVLSLYHLPLLWSILLSPY
jgi:hypothetical protein